MDIATLGAVGEFVGGVAVIVTLIYLAFQTRISARTHSHSVEALSAHMLSQNVDGWVQFYLQTAMDERLSAIVAKLRQAQPLSEAERTSAGLFLSAFFLRLENLEYHRVHSDWQGLDDLLRKQVRLYAASPDFRQWWSNESPDGFSDGFRDTVNAILKECG